MKPLFSIIIPVGPGRNAEVINSISNCQFPKSDYEIIVEEGTNPSMNRNRGALKARGKILIFLDDDAFVDTSFLDNAANFLNLHPDVDLVGGPQLTPPQDGFFGIIGGYAISSFFASYTMSHRYKVCPETLDASEFDMTSANLFVRKTSFEKIGGFDERIFPGEDPEFLARAKLKGFCLAYSPDIKIYHKRRPTPKLLFRQFYLYGRARLLKEHILGTRFNPVFLAPPIFAVYIFSIPFLVFLFPLGLTVLLLYAFLCFLSYLYEMAIHRKIILFFLLPFFYFLIHFSYGLGFLVTFFSLYLPFLSDKRDILKERRH